MNKDKINNSVTTLLNKFRFYILGKCYGKFTNPRAVATYSDVYGVMSEQEFDDKFIRSQYWGVYHPKQLQQWYDPAAIKLDWKGLNLKVTDNPYTVPGSGYIITDGVGLVTSKRVFSYGVYEWIFSLPKGRQLWPAIWLSNVDTWPPEIDVMEGYSNYNMKYDNRIETNIHCGNGQSSKYSLGAKGDGWLCKDTNNITAHLHWTRDFIKIYYNGYLVRQITDKKHLAWFNGNPGMRVIMNNAIRYNSEQYQISDYTVEDFTIGSFRYWDNV